MLKPKKTVKKCLSWLLALVMILSVIPVAVLAAPADLSISCLLYTSPTPRDRQKSRMPSSA